MKQKNYRIMGYVTIGSLLVNILILILLNIIPNGVALAIFLNPVLVVLTFVCLAGSSVLIMFRDAI